MTTRLTLRVRCSRAGRVLAAVVLGLLIVAGPAAAATTWYVDGTFGNDLNACTSPGIFACRTIQAAINKASNGDTIIVAAGIYPEPAPGSLLVNKTLKLFGAQMGVDARVRVAPPLESRITDPQGTSVTANNVVIDGFTVEASTSAVIGYGIWLAPSVSGTQILNNIIQNNIIGIGLANNNGSPALIRRNQIQANNVPGPATGSGIYTDQFAGGTTVRNVVIEENAFVANNTAGINISNTAPAGGVFNLDVLTNTFDANGRALLLFNTHDSTIQGNTFTNSTAPASAAIRLLDNNSNLSIKFNDLQTGAGRAIQISFLGFVGAASSDVVINENNIGTVGPASFAGAGLQVDPGGHDDTVDAQCNWWGSPTGPTNVSNPSGTGEEVVGDADFTPWLIAPFPGGACGITPGKVTGGGQIAGDDPVFSPLGELLSLPALVPSASDPGSNATFGFNVKCCAPSGNLEYNDHDAEVRIKVVSVDALNIRAPGDSCPATPGSKHAQFAGMADVIRPTGTTRESFTVNVDDCGEPGTADTFGIKTTTYSNGWPVPNTLIGGNIKIH